MCVALLALGFCVTLCCSVRIHVCMCVCSLEFLHISRSATTLECDSPSFSHLSSLPILPLSSCQPALASSQRVCRTLRGESVGTQVHAIKWQVLSVARENVTRTYVQQSGPFFSPFQTHLRINKLTCVHAVALIKAFGVSTEICNPDI